MKPAWWMVAALLAWGACGSDNATSPSDGGTLDAARDGADTGAVPDSGVSADGLVDTGASRDVADTGAADAADATQAADDGGGDALVASPTWSGIYADLFVNPAYASNCMGSSCHDPGTQKGIDLSTPAKGFSTLHGRIVPGRPDSSSLYTNLASGNMPRGKPRLSKAELARVRDWILAGAPNN
jgi:hypothetical protein